MEPIDPSISTMLQHLGEGADPYGAVVSPIYQNSLFVHRDLDDFLGCHDDPNAERGRFVYSRLHNPTLQIAEKKIAALEKCERSKVFGSGMAAISAAIMSQVKAGCHVVCVNTAYGPAQRFLREYLHNKFGVQTTFVMGSSTEQVLGAITDETTLVVLESPGSLFFDVQDIGAIGAFCRERGIITMIDSTYSGGILMNPSDHQIDLVVHSATKYFAGHSDLTAGVVAGPAKLIDKMVTEEYELFGGGIAPMQAWLLIRGLRTLGLRLPRHGETGHAVAMWLKDRPEVERIYHVGDPDHPQADWIKKNMRGSGGLFSFRPKAQEYEKIRAFVNSLKIYQLGVSWGGFESLVVALNCPDWQGQTAWTIRLYCGLESPHDLMADLEQALRHLA